MAFLSDLDKKITMLGQGALQKTKDVTDAAKMSAAIRTLDVQRKETLEKLGEFYYDAYQQYGGELSDQAADLVAQIQNIDAQKKQLQGQMQKIRGTVYCPNCNTEIPANSQFCNVCGAKIERPQVQENIGIAMPGNVCAKCGAPLEADQMFCTNCGAKVEQEPVAQEDPAPAYEEEPKAAESANVCPNCGRELKPDQKFCTGCGTQVK